jgi:hypothetical protein
MQARPLLRKTSNASYAAKQSPREPRAGSADFYGEAYAGLCDRL